MKRPVYYVLDEYGTPAIEPDFRDWAEWIETHDRQVALDEIGEVRVSTVFLGIDHGWGTGEPVLFETMIFGGPNDQYQERYNRRIDAIARHAEIVSAVREGVRL